MWGEFYLFLEGHSSRVLLAVWQRVRSPHFSSVDLLLRKDDRWLSDSSLIEYVLRWQRRASAGGSANVYKGVYDASWSTSTVLIVSTPLTSLRGRERFPMGFRFFRSFIVLTLMSASHGGGCLDPLSRLGFKNWISWIFVRLTSFARYGSSMILKKISWVTFRSMKMIMESRLYFKNLLAKLEKIINFSGAWSLFHISYGSYL